MRLNSDKAFFHPVTHRLIESNSFYKGAAHLEHEIIEEVKGNSKTGKGKSTASKDSEENKDDE